MLHRARIELVRVIKKCLHRVCVAYPVPLPVGLDTWDYRSFGDSLYGKNLGTIDVAAWHVVVDVREDALLFECPILRAHLRAYKK